MPSITSERPANRPASPQHGRLVNRFFEGLLTLVALGRFRGDRVSMSQAEQNPRRQFEQNLVFVCDFEKGGSSTTAGALENSENCYKFWIASNDDHSHKEPTPAQHLREVIALLCKISKMSSTQRIVGENALIEKCIQFARRRIREERKLVLDNAITCLDRLDKAENMNLIEWLYKFTSLNSQSDTEFCQHAYDSRRDTELRELGDLGRSQRYHRSEDHAGSPFIKAKHYIGRVAHHIRASKQLADYASGDMSHILESCEVCPVPRMAPSARPGLRGRNQNPDAICTRLGLDKGTANREAFLEMNRKHHLTKNVSQLFEHSNYCNGVHAEIQVLEHFSRNKLRFVGNDPFVACSKPACYCCHLYFVNHPSGPIEPETHKKIYPNWAPPALREGVMETDETFIEQKRILNEILRVIKRDAKLQVQQGREAHPFYPDSTTGITNTVQENEAACRVILSAENLPGLLKWTLS